MPITEFGVAGHADVGDEAGAARKDARVGGLDMGVGADDEADAAVDEMAERLFLARRLGMEIDDRCVAAGAKRAGGEFPLDALEWVVERVHEHAAHQVDDQHLRSARGLEQVGAAPGRAGGVVGRADQARLALDEHKSLALVERVVAERDRVGAGAEELLADRLGDAKAAGGVLAINDDEIEPPVGAQFRQAVDQRRAPGAPDNVADEQQPHQPRPRASIHSRSVRMKSSRSSCGSSGAASISETA